jgi:hypothetical protein
MASTPTPGPILANSITKLPPGAAGGVVVAASHGGRYPGHLAAAAGVRAVLLNDAGGGAGIGALALLDAAGIAATTVSHLTCRIGDAADMFSRGRISHANGPAAAVGVVVGMECHEAARLLQAAPLRQAALPPLAETRGEVLVAGAVRRLLLLDSASLVQPADAGHIVVTGSHGGLLGGQPGAALAVAAFAAVFNDAGIGIDRAGLTRLPALAARGIAAFTVAAASARIGEAASSFRDGVISAANAPAVQLGAREGERAAPLLEEWARQRP